MFHGILCVPSQLTALYSQNSVESIGMFAMTNNGGLEIVGKIDRSVVGDIFPFGNDFVLGLVLIESASLADDTDYDFCYTT
jgi:hypothetical protein